MISGLSSSGIATAIRTAGQARATMDTMTRQIATGQRVSSVRDDGAAWARANALKNDAAGQRTVASSMRFVRHVIDAELARSEPSLQRRYEARDAALRATDPSMSASTRSQLDAAQEDLFAAFVPAPSANLSLMSTTGSPWNHVSAPVNNILAVLTDANGGITGFQGAAALPGLNSPVRGDLSSAAAAAIALNNITQVEIPFWEGRAQYWSGVSVALEQRASWMERGADRLEASVSTLTDADLGRAAAARAQAETRQQLALTTVRQAISAYGNFAGGLLGNVQRTQRGIMA